ncbi:DNA methylase N-4 [bacterium]|nr:DNA methylase N-4 [bacterium]
MAGLKVSLAMYGDIGGIVWNSRTGELVAGHQLPRALKALYGDGLKIEGEEIVAPTGERWAIRVVDWDEGTALGALVSANNPHISGEFDDGLQEILGELKAADAELFAGLCLDELIEEVRLPVGEDEVPDVLPQESRVKPGEVWALGEHRLLCGDSTSAVDVGRLMAGARAAMAFTDPPYNVAYRGAAGTIMNDDLGGGFGEFLRRAMSNLLRFTDGGVYVCMSSGELDALQAAFRGAGGHWSTFIIWAKDSFVLGRADYHRQYEPILYGWKEGAQRHWCGARDQGDVWQCDRPKESKLHPTMKPPDLIARALRNSSEFGDVILDLFGGSGSTLIACEAAGRRARVMELDPKFCDVILARWEKFTGSTAARLEGAVGS